jgi:hypothetical protein
LCKDCGAHCDAQDHAAGPAGTPDAAVVCKDCGYIITPAKNHKHNLTKVARKDATCTKPGNLEYYTCDGCSDYFADSEGKTKVTDTVIAPSGHTISEAWQFDANNHWRTCTACKAVLAETQMAHEMTGEKCTTCGYGSATPVTDPGKEPQNSQDKQDDVFPWWGYAVIILGGITAGIGIALILIKRKKKS